MRGFVISALILILAGGACLAQPAAPVNANKTGTNKAMARKSFSGKIQSVAEADQSKGTKSEIAVAGKDGTVKTFLVKAGTTIYALDGKALTLRGLNAGMPVKVNFQTSAEGVSEALGIYQTK